LRWKKISRQAQIDIAAYRVKPLVSNTSQSVRKQLANEINMVASRRLQRLRACAATRKPLRKAQKNDSRTHSKLPALP
jgi:hypothetical protein